jgi:hypothetical protein
METMPPLSGFQSKCIALMNAAPRTHATHCFRSSLYHLERAELLREVDPGMAIFRAITAEEEAASGVMRCMVEMGYPASDKLNPHDHAHKHAVFPFMQVLGLFFGQTLANHFTKYNLHIKEEDGATRLMLALNVKINGDAQLAYPVPPLNFGVKNPDTGEAPDYAFQINQLIAAKGRATVKAFLKNEANLRNEILYAGPDGYPTIPSLDVGFLVERRARVLAMINLYLLVFPYREHQPFVAQALASFVKMLQHLKRSRGEA